MQLKINVLQEGRLLKHNVIILAVLYMSVPLYNVLKIKVNGLMSEIMTET